ncbi:MAG: hypothetical protein AB7I33_12245, partial [Gemmatimonadales bacterium]
MAASKAKTKARTRPASGIDILGPLQPGFSDILTPDALHFLATLHRRFEPTRRALL